jgi:glutamate-1-semialdehyde 2,1-aminomutase
MFETHAVLRYRGALLGSSRELPIMAVRGKGAYIWDSAGRKLLDFILGYGAVVIGHGDARVDDEVVKAIRNGVCRSLYTELETVLTDELVEVAGFAGTGAALLLRTGSDATQAAVRLCRAATGRDTVLRVGYNGWHDWCAPRKAGVPGDVSRLTVTAQFNDIPMLLREIRAHADDLACVIMVPTDTDPPVPTYLEQAAAATRSVGAVFVLDEVRTGFRLALGGAQQHFGVQADVVTYSKALANGYPISALVGRSWILQQVANVSLSSLYFRGSDGTAAALATMDVLRHTDALQRIWQLGDAFQAGLTDIAKDVGAPVRATGLPVMPFHEFCSGDPRLDGRAAESFSVFALEKGVLFHPTHHWFVCEAMTEADLVFSLEAARHAYRRLTETVYRGLS